LHNLASFWEKNATFFAKIFGENILKIITSVPGHDPTDFEIGKRHGLPICDVIDEEGKIAFRWVTYNTAYHCKNLQHQE
jgi:valyl-tRNA synthetase